MYLPDFFTVYISGSGLILPKHQTITSENTADNFGDAYNNVVHQAINDGHNDILVCNDDIVFTPYTWPTLAEDLQRIPAEDPWMGCYAVGLCQRVSECAVQARGGQRRA
jgi:hypothetical protein